LSIQLSEFDRAAELPQQRELFTDAFPENRGMPAASTDHYCWKFCQAPVTPHSHEFVAKEDGRMLGYYAAIPYLYRVGDRDVRAGMTCDVMTHSQARGKGVFTKLGRFAVDQMSSSELSFLMGYPIRPEVMGGHLRVGWQVTFDLPMFLRPLRANAILRSRSLGWLAPPVNGALLAYQAALRKRPRRDHEVVSGDPVSLFRSPRFATFLQSWSEGVRNHLVKSTDFYDWRLGAPGTSYKAFLVLSGETILAAAVGRVANLQGIPSLALLDLMTIPGERAALDTLFDSIDREARVQGVEAVVTMMSRTRAREYRLARHGFLKSPFTFKLIVHELDGTVPSAELTAEENWHLMWIDSDDL
jgi:hypothetical protein